MRPDVLKSCMDLFTDVKLEPECSNEDYHGAHWKSISTSRLKRFREDPYAYYMEFVTKESARKETDALIFGRILHEVVLECMGLVDETNYRENTIGVFRDCPVPQRDPDIENEFEKIWVVNMPEPGVVRQAAIWDDLDNEDGETFASWHAVPDRGDETRTAMCAFADMHRSGVAFHHIPRDVLSGVGAKTGKSWTSWKKEHGDLPHMKTSEWYGLLSMRSRLRSHGAANRLLFQGGSVEQTIVGTCVSTGLQIRCRTDHLKVGVTVMDISDLKSTRDSSKRAWKKQAYDDGLHIQAAIYSGLVAHICQQHHQHLDTVDFQFPVIAKERPWRPAVYMLEDEFIEIGVDDYLSTVQDFAQCVRTNTWEPEGFGDIETLETPGFLQTKFVK